MVKNFLICAKCGGAAGHLVKTLFLPCEILCFSYVETMFYVGVGGVKGAKRKPLDVCLRHQAAQTSKEINIVLRCKVSKTIGISKIFSKFF